MHYSNRRYLFVAFLFAFVFTACSPQSSEPTNPVDPQQGPAAVTPPTEQPTPEPTEALVALVNGQAITLARFQSELAREEARLAEVGVVPADRAVFESSVLHTMIDQVLIEQAASVQGLAVTDSEVETEIAVNIELAGGMEAWQAWLNANYLTEEEFRTSIYSALLTGKIRDLVIASVPESVPQAHARHILVSTEAEAQAVYQQVMGGTDFAQLALEHSRDVSTRELGGDLGWFAREQLTEPVVADVAFSQEIGQISQPVASRLGYHIIQTLDRVDERPLDDLSRAALFEMTFERWRQSLWDQATVQEFIGG